MRNAFANEIERLAAADSRIVLLSGDIGNRLFDSFKSRFPDRFYNCGVAEANMISMAAGLAMTGLRPVVYTIASFLIYRPYEQIRVDIGYHQLPVCLVGVGSGLGYASNGVTHHTTEDIAAIRAIPGFQIFNAGDAMEVRSGLRAAVESDVPFYLRIGKKREPVVHSMPPTISAGQALQLRSGNDCYLIASGNLLPVASEASTLLSNEGIQVSLYSSPFIRPLDAPMLSQCLDSGKPIFILEEHSRSGGLGSAWLEWANDHGYDTRKLIRLGTNECFLRRTTNHQDARRHLKLDASSIQASIREVFTAT